MTNNHTVYFAALTDGLTNFLPPDPQFEQDDSIQKAKRLLAIDTKNTSLDEVHSIMPTIIRENVKSQALPLTVVDKNSGIFPTQDDGIETVDTLLQELKTKLENVTDSYTLYHYLYRYTARIGCDAEIRETSLFDRNRLLAAVTACLKQSSNEPKFYLVKGDLSGIQNFIYANFSLENPGDGRKSSKRLRGRSFLVAMLTNFIAEYIVEHLGLFQANIIFAGGGHFNLLLPGNIGGKLEEIEQEVNDMLIDKVGLTTSLVLAKTKIDTEENATPFKDVSEYYSKLAFELDRKKQQRNLNQLDTFMLEPIKSKELVKLNNIGMNLGETIPRTNVIAQIELETEEDVIKMLPIEGDSEAQKREKRKLGIVFNLTKAKTIFVAFKDDNGTKLNNFIKGNQSKIVAVKIIQLNDSDLSKSVKNIPQTGNIPISYGFTFVGKYAPTFDEKEEGEADEYNKQNNLTKFKDKYKDGDVKPFDALAGMPKEEISFAQLAVVRLDIDNLGSIFACGLGTSTFERLATLSREFNQFFSGYFNQLADDYDIYIVYSGGDDAFIVGSWYNVLHFMVELKKKFTEFVCDNSEITFSAGIFMCHPHYPVGRFAKDAAAYEDKAKDYISKAVNPKYKNAVHIFDHTLSWDSFESKMNFALKLERYTNTEGTKKPNQLARSLVHRILRILRSCIDEEAGTIDVNTNRIKRNVARLHYLFARHGFDEKRIKATNDGIANEIVQMILLDFNNPDIIVDYLIPLNYVIMKTRKMN